MISREVKIVFSEYRAETLPLRFEAYDARFLVDVLTRLLGRAVYSERAGILPPVSENILEKRLGAGRLILSARFAGWLNAQAADAGHVLVDSRWIDHLLDKNPRALASLLMALDGLQGQATRSGARRPLIAVIGNDEIYQRIIRGLQKDQQPFRENGLDWKEKLANGHFLQPSRLKELIQVVPAGKVNDYVELNHFGVAALLAGDAQKPEWHSAVQFLLDPRSVQDHDLMAVVFVIPALLKAAALIRGIKDPAERIRKLREAIDQIVPGASSQGDGFVIQLAEYIDQIVVKERLLEASA